LRTNQVHLNQWDPIDCDGRIFKVEQVLILGIDQHKVSILATEDHRKEELAEHQRESHGSIH
jgi:hypothetical protein